MSYDFFSMNTICENAVLHHRLFYCVSELFRVPGNHKRPQLSRPAQRAWLRGNPTLIREIFGYSVNPDQGRPSNAEFLCAVCDYLNR